MKLADAIVFVTGANRGIGLAFARHALARGARKVYAAARDPASVLLAGVQPVRLDVTDPAQVAAAATACADVTLVVNNAGIARTGSFLDEGAEAALHEQLETNVFGMLRMSQAFAPVLARQGGGAIVNVLSIASWMSSDLLGGYSLTKSAAWSLTNGLRLALRTQGTQVLGMHMGFVDTDLTRGFDMAKSTPDAVVARAYDALEAGASEVLADDITQQVKRGLSADAAPYLSAFER
jgi:NAD(P)-dependent dehydrogenase (short-subunit alcohol dehydrogenase family)